MYRYSNVLKLPLHIRNYATPAKLVRKTKPKVERTPLITCKLDKFNYFHDQIQEFSKAKFADIPLASYGWKHHKSKDDFFTIHAMPSHMDNFLETVAPFDSFGLDAQLCRNITGNFGIIDASCIQAAAMTHVRNMNHTLIAAETGCGKTLAYLVPIIHQIVERKRCEQEARSMNTPLAIVLTPGRELAEQIGGVAERLCTYLDINVNVLVGGQTKQKLINPSFADLDLLIGSVGAVSKLVTTGIHRMHQVRHVVLDEADTLLDDSFLEKLVHLLTRFPFHRNHLDSTSVVGTQLVLATATMPTNSTDVLRRILDPESICEVVSPNLHRLLPHVKQTFLRMRKINRPMKLLREVKADVKRSRSVLIFGNKSATSDYISIFLNDNGVKCFNLNGDMLQKIRAGRFESFQNGEIRVLATTDISSRGLDTTGVRHIINFDFPLHMADYIHRIGRIGRYGSAEHCKVTNFISSLREIDLVQRIEHTARTGGALPNVNANITNIIHKRVLENLEQLESDMVPR